VTESEVVAAGAVLSTNTSPVGAALGVTAAAGGAVVAVQLLSPAVVPPPAAAAGGWRIQVRRAFQPSTAGASVVVHRS
jgi:hypothetical protein